jgi:hypothetical protein
VAGGSASRGGGAPVVRRSREQVEYVRLDPVKLLVVPFSSSRSPRRRIEDGPATSSAPWHRRRRSSRKEATQQGQGVPMARARGTRHPGFIGARRRVGRGAHAKGGGGSAVRSSPAALWLGPDGPHAGSWPGWTGSGLRARLT